MFSSIPAARKRPLNFVYGRCNSPLFSPTPGVSRELSASRGTAQRHTSSAQGDLDLLRKVTSGESSPSGIGGGQLTGGEFRRGHLGIGADGGGQRSDVADRLDERAVAALLDKIGRNADRLGD